MPIRLSVGCDGCRSETRVLGSDALTVARESGQAMPDTGTQKVDGNDRGGTPDGKADAWGVVLASAEGSRLLPLTQAR